MEVVEAVVPDPSVGAERSFDMCPQLTKDRRDERCHVHGRTEDPRTGELVHTEVGLCHLEWVAMCPHDAYVRESIQQGVNMDGVRWHFQRPDARRTRLKHLQCHALVLVGARHVGVEEPVAVRSRRHDHVPDERLEVLVEDEGTLGRTVGVLPVRDGDLPPVQRGRELVELSLLRQAARIAPQGLRRWWWHRVARLPVEQRTTHRVLVKEVAHDRGAGARQPEDDERSLYS